MRRRRRSKEDNGDFENLCDNAYVDGDVKIRDHCHITGKYRGSAHRDFNIDVKLNHKIPVIFHNYDSYLTMQELGTFSLKMSYQMDWKSI